MSCESGWCGDAPPTRRSPARACKAGGFTVGVVQVELWKGGGVERTGRVSVLTNVSRSENPEERELLRAPVRPMRRRMMYADESRLGWVVDVRV